MLFPREQVRRSVDGGRRDTLARQQHFDRTAGAGEPLTAHHASAVRVIGASANLSVRSAIASAAIRTKPCSKTPRSISSAYQSHWIVVRLVQDFAIRRNVQ